MDERYRKSLLYDFYGELLNEHQKQVFSAAIFDDMSYSELADEFGCSRQAAFDLVKRISNKLENYESKMGLLKRFTEAKDKMNILTSTVEDIKESLFSQQDKDIKTNDLGLCEKLDSVINISKEIFDEF
ncbi:MAG: DNA-binding protein [Eubacterium sp.]|nr:DNA-binding protein [Eubacterium sp.]